ncbi:unnamed protein product [Polarella glacialis]|uniref:DUF5672 domain-containing protein n=1 Tax=Polarella glacialis TaxID=89957 RepID=A0A813GGL2_POLGL|nr:unnamed protein product [Polarella glacialis]
MFYSQSNRNFVFNHPSFKDLRENIKKLFLTPLPEPYYSHNFAKPGGYSLLLETEHFWDLTLTPKLLLFQADSWVCPGAASRLPQFLKCHYVGAPWRKNHKVCPCLVGVGNGGFSIRDKEAMKRVIRSDPVDPRATIPAEDVYFCSHLQGSTPSKSIAVHFAHEGSYDGEDSVDVYIRAEQILQERSTSWRQSALA